VPWHRREGRLGNLGATSLAEGGVVGSGKTERLADGVAAWRAACAGDRGSIRWSIGPGWA
jgi:hypothetical protein